MPQKSTSSILLAAKSSRFVAGALVVALLLACAASCRASGTDPTPPSALGPGFGLVFDDEFNSPHLDTDRWVSGMPWGEKTTGDAEYYSADALSLQSGILRFVATRAPEGDRGYKSGGITSAGRFEFLYGYAEIRARVPKGRGLWPAFWLLSTGSSKTGEVDVLEVLGHEPNRNHMTLHVESGPTKSEEGTAWDGPDLSAAYHTYGVDWEPDHITWYVDGVERFRTRNDVPARPMCLITNLAVGGPASWPGPPDATTRFPATLEVDYVRVFRRD